MRIIQLSVFYRNDRPDGFGFTLLNEDANLDFVWATLKENYTLMWREAVVDGTEADLILGLKSQLEAVIRTKGTLTMTDPLLYMAIGNVWLLIEIGELAEDDFNGLMYAYGD